MKGKICPKSGSTLKGLCAVLCLVTQLCLTICNPIDCSPPGSPVPGDSPGKNTGVGSLSLLQGNFLTQESNQGLSALNMDSLPAGDQGGPHPV